jgi:hypothetical protein
MERPEADKKHGQAEVRKTNYAPPFFPGDTLKLAFKYLRPGGEISFLNGDFSLYWLPVFFIHIAIIYTTKDFVGKPFPLSLVTPESDPATIPLSINQHY